MFIKPFEGTLMMIKYAKWLIIRSISAKIHDRHIQIEIHKRLKRKISRSTLLNLKNNESFVLWIKYKAAKSQSVLRIV